MGERLHRSGPAPTEVSAPPAGSREQRLGDILATAAALGTPQAVAAPEWEDAPTDPALLRPGARRSTKDSEEELNTQLLGWMLHETQTLRDPVYRTRATDEEQVGQAEPDPEQLPLIRYTYDEGDPIVLSRMGELIARDVRVMSVISQIYWESGCPSDGMIRGDEATLGYIAKQLGMHPEGATNLIKASIMRLATAKVVWKQRRTVHDKDGRPVGEDDVEISLGFLANWGFRTRRRSGMRERRDNYIQLDPMMSARIREQSFTWLRGDVVRRLKDDPLATKLYMFMRSQRPTDRGTLEYGVMRLAHVLGCSDTKKARVRRRLEAAARAIVRVAGHEFPEAYIREGRRDHVLVMHKVRRVSTAPVRVIEGTVARSRSAAASGRRSAAG